MNSHSSLTYEHASDAYETEINNFANAVNYLSSKNTLGNITEYAKLLKRQAKSKSPYLAIFEATNGSATVDMSNMPPLMMELVYTAHIGACALLVNGSKFTEQQFQPDAFKLAAMQSFPQKSQASDEVISSICIQLANLDALRTMQLLKVFGLINRSPEKTVQLALGCGAGDKDYQSIHSQVVMQKTEVQQQVRLEFDVKIAHPKHITMIDGDKVHTERYEQYNSSSAAPINAIVGDMLLSLDDLISTNFEKVNLVTVLRMEHRMIPDVGVFFSKLSQLITDECDFIFSIGLGDTIEDFEGRTKLVSDVFAFLKKAKLRPVLFKMHEAGDLSHQWASLKFGYPKLATYQILYCKLSSKALIG